MRFGYGRPFSHALVIGAVCLAPALIMAEGIDNRLPAAPEIITVTSRFQPEETVERLKAEIVGKGIRLFGIVDQAALGREAGADVRPSILLEFGNPALGARFVALNPLAGLDWPVRVLVNQDEQGVVRVSYFNFAAVARRYGIAENDPAFVTATGVVASLTSAIRAE